MCLDPQINRDQAILMAQAVKQKYEKVLLAKRHVVGVGVGLKNGTDEVVIIVQVTVKVSGWFLWPRDRIPKTLDDVSVQVIESGQFQAR